MQGRMLNTGILTTLLLATLGTLAPQPVQVRAVTSVSISNFAFNPAIGFVSQGETVTWTNNDKVVHTLWFTDPADGKTVALSDPIPPGGSWSGVFTSPIRIRYYDFHRLWITGDLVLYPASLFPFDWADADNTNKVSIIDVANIAICFDKLAGVGGVGCPGAQATYWDFDLDGKVSIIDVSLIAILFDQTTTATPFPGQGRPANTLDPVWKQVCNGLPQPDRDYCNTLP